ncbi:hypothetical protein PIB30_104468, partial [Stylosanthes scabra]|nr:hypothetical protein [Stylosanthes scabra]
LNSSTISELDLSAEESSDSNFQLQQQQEESVSNSNQSQQQEEKSTKIQDQASMANPNSDADAEIIDGEEAEIVIQYHIEGLVLRNSREQTVRSRTVNNNGAEDNVVEKAARTVGSGEALRQRAPCSTEPVTAGGGASDQRPAVKGETAM